MASTTFIDGVTKIVASWLNPVNTTIYALLGNGTDAPATKAELRTNIGASTLGDSLFTSASPSAARTAISAAVSGANTDITSLNSPALGAATATTQSPGDNTTKVSTTAFVSAALASIPHVRQSVVSGPVNSDGTPNFGGSTGSTTVTASGTIVASFANGLTDRVCTIVNPSWTGLSTNGTRYLFLEGAADGTCTTLHSDLAPTYRQSGTDVVTNGQHTFNIKAMQMKVGNGSTASQTWRVCVGQVTISGSVVTAITWYALGGETVIPNYGLALNTVYSNNHNIGCMPQVCRTVLVCTTGADGYSIGDEIDGFGTHTASNDSRGFSTSLTATNLTTAVASTAITIVPKTGGAIVNITVGNYRLKTYIARGW